MKVISIIQWNFREGNDDVYDNAVYVLNLQSGVWRRLETEPGRSPCARAGHAACVIGDSKVRLFHNVYLK